MELSATIAPPPGFLDKVVAPAGQLLSEVSPEPRAALIASLEAMVDAQPSFLQENLFAESMTSNGERFDEIVGSPYYMAPEVLKRDYRPKATSSSKVP